MYYLQSLYYDRIVGRFINADDANTVGLITIGSKLNTFSYCENTPVNSVDASGRFTAQLVARIIIGAMIGLFAQLLSDLIAVWFASITNQKATPVMSNGGDYVASMISWALTCVSFNSKVVQIIASLIPFAIKHVSRWVNNKFNVFDFFADAVIILLSFLVNTCLDKFKKVKLDQIIKKAGRGSGASRYINIRETKLNLTISVLGIKFNLTFNIAGSFISNVYTMLAYVCTYLK